MAFADSYDRVGHGVRASRRSIAARLADIAEHVEWTQLGILIALGVFAFVAFALYRILSHIAWDDARGAMHNVPWTDIAGAALATAASYLALAGLDILALRAVGANRVPLLYAASTSFISHSFTFTLGFGVLTGGAVRLRLYQLKGLAPVSIIAAGILCALTFWMGLAAIGGICLVIEPGILAPIYGLPPAMAVAIGGSILAALTAWIAYSALRPTTLAISGWRLSLPDPGASLASIGIGIADTAFAGLALWLLLPGDMHVAFPGFLVIFVMATVLGVLSHVPGGLGVFEAVILLGLPGLPAPEAVGSLLLFRLVYYVGPFALAAAGLGAQELRAHSDVLSVAQRKFLETAGPLLRPACSVAVFVGGIVLLVSGALPADHDRMVVLRRIVPLPFVETSHFVASLVGAVLLVVGYGLAQRLRSAWNAAVALLAAGMVFSLIKGIDYEEALVCLAIIALLLVARPEFYRRSGLLEAPLSWEWLLAIAAAILASTWVGMAAYQHVSYKSALWWHFAYGGDAPRFLRASLGVAVAGAMFALHRVLNAAHPGQAAGRPQDLAKVRAIVDTMPRTDAQLALLGDKCFLAAEDGQGFLMYGVQGSTWLAMGDPVAADEQTVVELIWRFKESADLHNGKPAFYQVSSHYIPLYIDAGFFLSKLGEDAFVDLSQFTLAGSEGRKWRQSKSHAERKGLSFEVVPAADVPTILPLLKEVSDAWLAERGAKEKGFSLGFWSEPYLSRYDQAIVRHEGRIVAFANIWKAAGNAEYSLDLMRHLPDAPGSTMDYLFICLMEAAKAEGFAWFNLGMAPLSGLPRHRLASRWSRLGALIYRHGDSFYNFEGLRAFKSKFKPVWRPRYLAHPGGLSMAGVLMDATTLIATSPRRARKFGGISCA
jgi:phosphatidylglycerol lysyltransferase